MFVTQCELRLLGTSSVLPTGLWVGAECAYSLRVLQRKLRWPPNKLEEFKSGALSSPRASSTSTIGLKCKQANSAHNWKKS